jgi:hypothetical protein
VRFWKRIHKYGAIKTLLIGQGETNLYRIIVHEPRGEYRIRENTQSSNLVAAKLIADELVQRHYPHSCVDGECSPWENPYDSPETTEARSLA